MRRALLSAVLCFVFSFVGFAQENDNNPASAAHIQTLFETMHSRDQVNRIMDTMLQPQHQLIREMFLKDKDKLPQDFEDRMSKHMNDLVKNMPFDEMMQAMVPAYQRHLTKGDINALLAFYSSPTGQKMLREQPKIMSEAMQNMMPIMSRYIDEMQNKVQQITQQMIDDAQKKGEHGSKDE